MSSMCIMLLERGVILESELCEELDGDSLSPLDDVPKFNFGDKIKIRSESTKVRWRRPHIRYLVFTSSSSFKLFTVWLIVIYNEVVQVMSSEQRVVL